MEDITEDRVKTLTHEAINQRLDDFTENICKPTRQKFKEERVEIKEEMKTIHSTMADLTKCMNGKFNKLYYFLFILLGSVITTLIAVLVK